MKKIIYSILLLFVFAGNVQAQSSTKGTKWKLVYDNSSAFCPSPNSFSIASYSFTLLPIDTNVSTQSFAPPTYSWKVQNARNAEVSFSTNQTEFVKNNDSGIKLYFDDTTEKAKLIVTITGCGKNNMAYNVYDVTETFELPIRSNRGEKPKNLSINGSTSATFNVEYNDQNNFTLAVDPMKIPNSTTAYVDMYEYRIPNAWSLGTNASNVYFQGVQNGEKVVWVTQSPDGSAASTKLNIKLDACSTGKVRVRSMIKPSCAPYADPNEPYAAYYSIYSSEIYINRTAIPVLTKITADFLNPYFECGTSGIATIKASAESKNLVGGYKFKWRIEPIIGSPTNWSFMSANAINNTLDTDAVVSATGLSSTIQVQGVPNVDFKVLVTIVPNDPQNCIKFAGTTEVANVNRVNPVINNLIASRTEMCATETEFISVNLTTTGSSGIITSYDFVPLDKNAQSLVTVKRGVKRGEFIISPIIGVDGTATISFTATNTCGLTSAYKSVTIRLFSGKPINSGVFNYPKVPYCVNRTYRIVIEPVLNAGTYQWVSLSRNLLVDGYDTEGLITPRTEGLHRFAIITKNPCASDTTYYEVSASFGSPDCSIVPEKANALIYPNPTTTELNIVLPVQTSSQAIIRLVDGFGQVRKETTMLNVSDNKVIFDVQNLPQGIYYLHIIDESTTKQYQVMITR